MTVTLKKATLATALTTGAGSTTKLNGTAEFRETADVVWASWGTFDSATATLQGSIDAGVTWFAMDTCTAAAWKSIRVVKGQWVRVSTAGGGGSQSINSAILGVTQAA